MSACYHPRPNFSDARRQRLAAASQALPSLAMFSMSSLADVKAAAQAAATQAQAAAMQHARDAGDSVRAATEAAELKARSMDGAGLLEQAKQAAEQAKQAAKSLEDNLLDVGGGASFFPGAEPSHRRRPSREEQAVPVEPLLLSPTRAHAALEELQEDGEALRAAVIACLSEPGIDASTPGPVLAERLLRQSAAAQSAAAAPAAADEMELVIELGSLRSQLESEQARAAALEKAGAAALEAEGAASGGLTAELAAELTGRAEEAEARVALLEAAAAESKQARAADAQRATRGEGLARAAEEAREAAWGREEAAVARAQVAEAAVAAAQAAAAEAQRAAAAVAAEVERAVAAQGEAEAREAKLKALLKKLHEAKAHTWDCNTSLSITPALQTSRLTPHPAGYHPFPGKARDARAGGGGGGGGDAVQFGGGGGDGGTVRSPYQATARVRLDARGQGGLRGGRVHAWLVCCGAGRGAGACCVCSRRRAHAHAMHMLTHAMHMLIHGMHMLIHANHMPCACSHMACPCQCSRAGSSLQWRAFPRTSSRSCTDGRAASLVRCARTPALPPRAAPSSTAVGRSVARSHVRRACQTPCLAQEPRRL